MRRAVRHPVNYSVIGEHRQLGDIHFEIINISAHGFMATGDLGLGRGERLTIRLIWAHQERSGFQFERIVRTDDFLKLINAIQPNPRLRPRR